MSDPLSERLLVLAGEPGNLDPDEQDLLLEGAAQLELDRQRIERLRAVAKAAMDDPGAHSDGVYYAIVALQPGDL